MPWCVYVHRSGQASACVYHECVRQARFHRFSLHYIYYPMSIKRWKAMDPVPKPFVLGPRDPWVRPSMKLLHGLSPIAMLCQIKKSLS